MTKIQATSGLIELRHNITDSFETIPADLADEVIKALPDDHAIRHQLQVWRQNTQKIPLSLPQLQLLEKELAEYAHCNPSKLGMVGRLSRRSAGRIFGADDEEVGVSAIVVLALSVRRFIALYGVGIQLSLLAQDDATR